MVIARRAIEQSSVGTYLYHLRMALQGHDPNMPMEEAFAKRVQVLVLRKRGFSATKNV